MELLYNCDIIVIQLLLLCNYYLFFVIFLSLFGASGSDANAIWAWTGRDLDVQLDVI